MLRFLSIAATAILAFTMLYCDFNTNAKESHGEYLSWEEFKSMIIEEPDSGVFIVNGDTPINGEKRLREFYDNHFNPSLFSKIKRLIVHTSGGNDVVWSATQKKNLTYCVSKSKFGNRYETVVAAMDTATSDWESAADVNFIHVTSQDSNCTKSNNDVVFDVNPVSAFYVARAFFPDSPRSQRNILISGSAFNGDYPLVNVLRHEVGHTIGLRHEHTRPEAGTCYEDRNWRALTTYDRSSVMHYPHCKGNGDMSMTSKDRAGIAELYGSPGDNPPPPPPPPVEGDQIQKTYPSRSLSKDQSEIFGAYAVIPGADFNASITGSGDADLYVQFGSAPTKSSYNCRPYTNSTNEECKLEVPAGASKAYIMISSYENSSYQLSVDYLRPEGVNDASDQGDPQDCHEECHEEQNGCNTETVCETICE